MLLPNLTVIDPSTPYHGTVVDLELENGLIKSIREAQNGKERQPVVYVSPGWVDVFADYREPGYEQKETIATGLAAAAAGGFTDVLLAPNTLPAVSTKAVVQYVLQQARGHAVALHPLGAVSQNLEGHNLAEMLDMHAHGATAFTDGWQPVQNTALMLKALEYVKAFDGIILQMPDDKTLSAGALMHEGIESTRLGMPGAPAEAEELMVHRDVQLARYTGSGLHLTGVSTARSVAIIRAAKEEGIAVTCSVTPYHLALTDEALRGYSSHYKVTPPLRPEADRQALINALADGTIDCIATHHRPQDQDAKNKEFEYAGEGMALQELAFPVLWNAVGARVSVERLVDALAVKPREIFGLQQPSFAEGAAARLSFFSTGETTEKGLQEMKTLSRNNPFAGKKLTGRVLGVACGNSCTFAG